MANSITAREIVARGSRDSQDTQREFEASLFGPFRVMRRGEPVEAAAGLARTSARTLLKWFLLNPGTRVNSVALHELIWPARRSQTNLNRLHVTLHYLRHQLEPHLAARQPSSFIHSDGEGRYWFDFAGRWQTDVGEVAQRFAAGKQFEASNEIGSAIANYESILEYFGLTFLPENMFDEVFDSARAAQDVIRNEAENRLLGLYLRSGLGHQAIPLALSVLERDPYSESASVAIAEVSLQQGNVLAAKTHLADYVRVIRSELGVSPSGATLNLLERIRRAG